MQRDLIAYVEFSDKPGNRRPIHVSGADSLNEADWIVRAFEQATSEEHLRDSRRPLRLGNWRFYGWVEGDPIPPEGALIGTAIVLDGDGLLPQLSEADPDEFVRLCLRVRDITAQPAALAGL